ncbi:hypothetical protein GpartN1_g3336.t1 [Galdieria partita]|uniref:Translation factor GUF1 homolog, mitochondrial n=1 Tax=Galdieria partita TaxID=83374 RepID=A0A9C7UQG0_9RHOD|nr:hypothetical protein GpartN1_g3336.t1 [Galdieria partita]
MSLFRCKSLSQKLCFYHWIDWRKLCSYVPPDIQKGLSASQRASTNFLSVDNNKPVDKEYIRNFSIIAHVDHGKSTLADRLLQFTGTIAPEKFRDQYLDNMDIERERGITIKMRATRLWYRSKDGSCYLLNLIDTPGHVDFSYEVSRSLAAVEGCLLVVDASQGVQAQTIANVDLALENNLEIVPVLNKVDLATAEPDKVCQEISQVIGIDASRAVRASAKFGIGVEEILEEIVHLIPPPQGQVDAPLQALIFDSYFDPYRGVVVFIRVRNGEIRTGMKVKFMATGVEHVVEQVGILTPDEVVRTSGVLSCGEVGFIKAGIKSLHDAPVGDTITGCDNPTQSPLKGYKPAKSMVFCGLYPADSSVLFENLRSALEKLSLNDSSISFQPESSSVLGKGFRVGFLGMLHMEVVKERLKREYELELLTSAPSVVYKFRNLKGEYFMESNPSKIPNDARHFEEPYVKLDIVCPDQYNGTILDLCQNHRASLEDMRYVSKGRILLKFLIPLAEVLTNFYDQVKSRTRGFGSMDYEFHSYRSSDLVKLDIAVAGDVVEGLSCVVHRDQAYSKGKEIIEKLKKYIPRHQFKVVLQAMISAKVIASDFIQPLRKDVLAKCYGGDVSRKKKLLERQKEGKEKLRQLGKVRLSPEAFAAVVAQKF